MTAGELINLLKNVPPGATVCIAEVDEAFGAHVQTVDVVKTARADRTEAADLEAVQLDGGRDTVIVMRW